MPADNEHIEIHYLRGTGMSVLEFFALQNLSKETDTRVLAKTYSNS